MRATDAGERASSHDAEKSRPAHGNAHGQGSRGRVTDRPDAKPPACGTKEPVHSERNSHSEEKQRADLQRGLDRGASTPLAQSNWRQLGRGWLDKWFAEIEGETAPKDKHGNASGNVVDLRTRDEESVDGPKKSARCRCRDNPGPGAASFV